MQTTRRASERSQLLLLSSLPLLFSVTVACPSDDLGTDSPDPVPVASLEVSPPADTIEVDGTVQLTATARDSSGDPLEGRRVTWWSDDPSVASADSTGLVAGIAPGSAIITAISEEKSGSASLTVIERSTSGFYANEPPGYVPIFEHSFATMPPDERYPHDCPGGATVGCAAKFVSKPPWEIVSEPNAPQSPPGVLRLGWPSTIPESGDRVGVWYGWDDIEHTGSEVELAEMYVSFWFRVPTPDFEHPGDGGIKPFGFISVGQPAWTNALYLFTDLEGPQQVVTELSGFDLIIQNHLDWRRQPNIADLALSCGDWHHIEQVLVLNDIGSANGVYKLWFDEKQLFDLADVEYRTAAAPHGFNQIWWDPTWGGGTGDKARDDFTDIDHVYVSGIGLPELSSK